MSTREERWKEVSNYWYKHYALMDGDSSKCYICGYVTHGKGDLYNKFRHNDNRVYYGHIQFHLACVICEDCMLWQPTPDDFMGIKRWRSYNNSILERHTHNFTLDDHERVYDIMEGHNGWTCEYIFYTLHEFWHIINNNLTLTSEETLYNKWVRPFSVLDYERLGDYDRKVYKTMRQESLDEQHEMFKYVNEAR